MVGVGKLVDWLVVLTSYIRHPKGDGNRGVKSYI